MKYFIYLSSALLGIAVFVGIAQVSQTYSPLLTDTTAQVGLWGVFSYIGVTILAIVVAPLGTGFLLPVAANSFGPFLAAAYSIVGWLIGSLIAFTLARRYGQRFVRNSVVVQKIHHFERKMSPAYFFGFLVVLRLILPVDITSYALGLGSSVSYRVFAMTTFVGVIPFAFLFAYAAVSSMNMQVAVSTIGTIAFLLGIYFLQRQYRPHKKNT